jgi:hypothetical protein
MTRTHAGRNREQSAHVMQPSAEDDASSDPCARASNRATRPVPTSFRGAARREWSACHTLGSVGQRRAAPCVHLDRDSSLPPRSRERARQSTGHAPRTARATRSRDAIQSHAASPPADPGRVASTYDVVGDGLAPRPKHARPIRPPARGRARCGVSARHEQRIGRHCPPAPVYASSMVPT